MSAVESERAGVRVLLETMKAGGFAKTVIPSVLARDLA